MTTASPPSNNNFLPFYVQDMTFNPNPDGLTVLVDRTYNEGRPDQYIREVVHNAIKAQATKIRLTGIRLSEYGVEGGVKLACVDNGYGMSADVIGDYLGQLFNGQNEIDENGHFNMGVRVSTLPFTDLLVASWVDGEDDGAVVRFGYNPETKRYAQQGWENEDGTFDTVGIASSELIHPIIEEAGHGTVFVLLGRAARHNTVGRIHRDVSGKFVYPNKRNTRADLLYLNSKFHTLPEGLDLKVMHAGENLEDWKKDIAPGEWFEDADQSVRKYSFSPVRGLDTLIKEGPGGKQGAESKGEVEVVSRRGYRATIKWALFKEEHYKRGGTPDKAVGTHDITDYGFPLGLFGELYQGEVYNVHEFGWTRHPMEKYGIAYPELRDRLVILVEPAPASAKFMGAKAIGSRKHLIVANKELPHDEWGEQWHQKMPQEIRDRIALLRGESSKEQEERLNRMRARLQKLFAGRKPKTTTQEPETGDTVKGKGGSGGTEGDGEGKTTNTGTGTPCPEGCTCGKHHPGPRVNHRTKLGSVGGTGRKVDSDAAEKKSTVALPEVKWVYDSEKAEGESREFGNDPALLVHWVSGGSTILINGDHKYLTDLIAKAVVERKPAVAEEIPGIVRDAIGARLAGYVMTVQMYPRSALVPVGAAVPDAFKAKGDQSKPLSDETLSAVLLDYETLDLVVTNAFKGRTGFGRIVPTQAEKEDAA